VDLEGKDPHTFLDAEREVFLFEHDVDLEKIPGTPHNEQMIKNFRSRGGRICQRMRVRGILTSVRWRISRLVA
jgi:hypothetical protein